MPKRIGSHTIFLENKPGIVGNAGVAGKKEGEGPLAAEFDKIFNDEFLGKDTFEKAESELIKNAVTIALAKADETPEEIDCCFAGDLLNQCIGSSFGLREFGIPFSGLYGACSTMALSLALGATLVDSGALRTAVCATSSHFCSAERQYRNPLEYGGQRPPSAQWTVTGAGAAVLKQGALECPRVNAVIFGKIRDLGITDVNNMGAAMAPAALDTILAHFNDLHVSADDFDLIVTGDLGDVGKEVLMALARSRGVSLGGKLDDCGSIVFDAKKQDVHAGGSGCGCSAITLCSILLDELNRGKRKKILFCGTGALLSPTSTQQGLPIPGVCHAVSIAGGNI